MAKTNPKILEALEATGLPFKIENGGKHRKIYLAGRFAGILPTGRDCDCNGKAPLNTITQIRRAAAAVKGEVP